MMRKVISEADGRFVKVFDQFIKDLGGVIAQNCFLDKSEECKKPKKVDDFFSDRGMDIKDGLSQVVLSMIDEIDSRVESICKVLSSEDFPEIDLLDSLERYSLEIVDLVYENRENHNWYNYFEQVFAPLRDLG